MLIACQNCVRAIENNPEKTAKLNERLNLIEKVKKKYGSTVEEIQLYQKNTLDRLHQMENADLKIEELQSELKHIENICNDLAIQLTSSRSRKSKSDGKGDDGSFKRTKYAKC